jgi:Tfp pilus assembly protein PilV
MNRLLTVVATTGAMVMQAHAVDSTDQSTMSKQQMFAQIVDCMKKRKSANKDSSYREAFKACKNQLNKGGDTESGALVASDPQVKPDR